MRFFRFTSALLLLSVIVRCSSTQEADDKPENKTPLIFKLECSGGQAIKSNIKRENNALLEKGPAILPEGVSCDDMSSKSEDDIRRLKRTGEWVLYYEGTMNVLSRGMYDSDKRTGEWKTFDEKGQLIQVSNYREGKKEGQETGFFAGTQEWRKRGQYSNNLATGRWQERPSLKSDCVSEGDYSEGKKDGTWKECDADKQTGGYYMAFEGGYSHGLRDGHAVTFYPNGRKSGEGAYRADSECQKNPPTEGESACGRRAGHWTIYFPDGKTAMDGDYDPATGTRTGTWTEYYRSGERMATGQRKNRRNGEWTFFAKNGTIAAKFTFNENEFMAASGEFYENGRVTGRGGLTNMLVQYDEAGDSLKLGTVFKNGNWTEFHPNGQKSGEGPYTMNKRNGRWIHYNEAGQKTMEGAYNMDFRNGDWTLYDASGHVQAQGPYMMGKRNGAWREYQNGVPRTLNCQMDRCQ